MSVINSNRYLNNYLLLVQVRIRADVVRDLLALHVEDLGTRNLVGVLDRALADLLVNDSCINALRDSIGLASRPLILISSVGVLVAL